MNKVTTLFLLLLFTISIQAQTFEDHFVNKSLRLDYMFSGNVKEQHISLIQLSELPSWAGRRHRLAEVPLAGNGDLTVKDKETGKVIYKQSFSSLFQEYLETDEAKQTIQRSYENCVLIPYPQKKVEVTICLYSPKREIEAQLTHEIDPKDILIAKRGYDTVTPHKYIMKSGDSKDCIDIAILAEGYTEQEMGTFYKDAEIAVASFLNHKAFRENKDKLNFVAVASPSKDSGVSIPRLGTWKNTAFSSNFSTFYSDRYLTTNHVIDIHNALAGIEYEHIIILANTDEYGGGGIYNHYMLTTAHHPLFKPVVVHEFGHSFAGLGDEYFYEDDPVETASYPAGYEPWEPNLTTLTDFNSKWKDMLKKGTPVPTPIEKKDKFPLGVFEGGGYATYGVYRPVDDCRMRTNTCKDFCPVCTRAVERMIRFYTE